MIGSVLTAAVRESEKMAKVDEKVDDILPIGG
jgi:hypothetical protein